MDHFSTKHVPTLARMRTKALRTLLAVVSSSSGGSFSTAHTCGMQRMYKPKISFFRPNKKDTAKKVIVHAMPLVNSCIKSGHDQLMFSYSCLTITPFVYRSQRCRRTIFNHEIIARFSPMKLPGWSPRWPYGVCDTHKFKLYVRMMFL